MPKLLLSWCRSRGRKDVLQGCKVSLKLGQTAETVSLFSWRGAHTTLGSASGRLSSPLHALPASAIRRGGRGRWCHLSSFSLPRFLHPGLRQQPWSCASLEEQAWHTLPWARGVSEQERGWETLLRAEELQTNVRDRTRVCDVGRVYANTIPQRAACRELGKFWRSHPCCLKLQRSAWRRKKAFGFGVVPSRPIPSRPTVVLSKPQVEALSWISPPPSASLKLRVQVWGIKEV